MFKIYLENLEFAWNFISTSCYLPCNDKITTISTSMHDIKSHRCRVYYSVTSENIVQTTKT